MELKLIACEVFFREICLCAASSPHRIDVEFTEKGAHDKSDVLRGIIQEKITAAESGTRRYDAILLGFGLCGNSVLGMRAGSVPLVIPRAHDCCTIFLGSRAEFARHFKDNPSMPFSSTGYMERGGTPIHEATTLDFVPGVSKEYQDLVAQYGEENARYIYETLTVSTDRAVGNTGDNRVVFIDVPEFSHLGFADRCRAQAEAAGKQFQVLPGDMRLIRKLVRGEWDPEEFLVVEPGRKIGGVYDWEKIMRAEEA
jgi:hypothetical protein